MTIRIGIMITAVAALSAMSTVACAGTAKDRAAAATTSDVSQATSPTAQDQSTQTTDAELTRKIRRELMGKDLSTRAKNVTIVTVDGMVTIKGTVPNAKEKATIGEIANRLAPNVRNDIAVK